MKRCWRWLLLVLLALAPSAGWAQDTESDEDPPERSEETEETPASDGLEIVDHGVAQGYVRKPLELRYRRSFGLTWICRGLLFVSEGAVVYAQYDQGKGFGYAPFFFPSLATGVALLSVNQMRKGLTEHDQAVKRPYWRLAGILTLVSGTATAWFFYRPEDPTPAYALLGLSQLIGVVLIQTQGWIYRREVRPGVWPFDRLGKTEQAARLEWAPFVAPLRQGVLAGAGARF